MKTYQPPRLHLISPATFVSRHFNSEKHISHRCSINSATKYLSLSLSGFRKIRSTKTFNLYYNNYNSRVSLYIYKFQHVVTSVKGAREPLYQRLAKNWRIIAREPHRLNFPYRLSAAKSNSRERSAHNKMRGIPLSRARTIFLSEVSKVSTAATLVK